MVVGHAGYALYMDYKNSRDGAQARLGKAIARASKDLDGVTDANLQAARELALNPALAAACNAHDRDALSKTLKAFSDKIGLDGFITIADSKGKVIYATDAPAKFGYSIMETCSGTSSVLRDKNLWKGPAAISPTGDLTITSMAPILSGSAALGVVAVSMPLNNEFLTGLVSKFKLLDEEPVLKNIDFAVVATTTEGGRVVAVSNNLATSDGGALSHTIRSSSFLKTASAGKPFESGKRMWQGIALNDVGHNAMLGMMLATTEVPDIMPRAQMYAGQAAASAAVAMVLAFIFSTAISGGIKRSLQFLIVRAQDLAAQKQNLAPLDGLQGEFYELAELMDTAVTSMRSTIQSMKSQLSKRSVETEEKVKQEDFSSEQLVHLNRQLSEKTRQLTELSKQINLTAAQTMILQQKLDAVLQISTEGFLMLDQYGNVLSANLVFLNWMGVKEGEIAGRFCFDLVKRPGEPRGDLSAQAFVRHSGNPAELINLFYPEGVVYHRYQDKSIEVLVHLQPVVADDQNVQAWIMVLRDKSIRSEVAQLRTEIVAMLSDSIRAPLISVESTWKTLLANAAQTMHPSVGQSLAQLHTHYEQLIGLVDSLLMMYGGIVPPPVIPRETVVVTRLVAECLEEISASAREHQLALDYKTVTGLPNLNSDREALKRVILQLLEKMISITAPGGRVRVESLVKGQEMRIGVTSSGPPLPQHEIDDMFTGFIEGKHDQNSYSSRLSVYLARNNVERLGGKIWAEAEPGKGTAIYVVMPVG